MHTLYLTLKSSIGSVACMSLLVVCRTKTKNSKHLHKGETKSVERVFKSLLIFSFLPHKGAILGFHLCPKSGDVYLYVLLQFWQGALPGQAGSSQE